MVLELPALPITIAHGTATTTPFAMQEPVGATMVVRYTMDGVTGRAAGPILTAGTQGIKWAVVGITAVFAPAQ